ncbi:potassium channel family protein [Acetobacterium woodii]|uniref:K+ uptake protein, NAD-binding subunit TrkA2 n=1 Tax=Acetobacterium woodii (strain ATCC 29683 / DSM 1030 / JCM 2381 / KCTC 1655 / WB1) TaxID=931626 RepID=H6LIZ3_ACEWD|nr:TrkA family potassium uptake protein [Acetobacterium woodii]AFA47356.1 K+ uptake protein, NAD-binding subunit TrkA2 [Acetobacterium woodii DSM 1030]
MYIIIIGCGKLGSTLAKELSLTGHDISVIDHDSEKLNVLGGGFNGAKFKGIEYDNDRLLEAGIKQAHFVLAVTADDNINITVSLIAKKIYNVPRIIARVGDHNKKHIYDLLGIETICPTQLGVEIFKRKISEKNVEVLTVIQKDTEILELTVKKHKPYTVAGIEAKFNCILSGLIVADNFIFPKPDELVPYGTKIICTIHKKDKEKLLIALAKEITL